MAKKATRSKKSTTSTTKVKRNYTAHHALEKPVHNLLSYTVLFALALVVLALVVGMSN